MLRERKREREGGQPHKLAREVVRDGPVGLSVPRDTGGAASGQKGFKFVELMLVGRPQPQRIPYDLQFAMLE